MQLLQLRSGVGPRKGVGVGLLPAGPQRLCFLDAEPADVGVAAGGPGGGASASAAAAAALLAAPLAAAAALLLVLLLLLLAVGGWRGLRPAKTEGRGKAWQSDMCQS